MAPQAPPVARPEVQAVVLPAPAAPRARRDILGWAGPVVAALIGGLLRVWHLGTPHAFVFDETYYAKDAYSLLRFGVERSLTGNANQDILDGRTNPSDVFTGTPEYVVHPPVGKWLIALGEFGFGVNPTGWRVAVVVASVISIVIVGRVVRRLTGNSLLGTIAAGLLALDGLHLVAGRTAVLDGFLMLFVLAAFAALLIDRDRARARYLREGVPRGMHWLRGWRLAGGVLLGLACGVKWSGLWYALAFAALALAWEVGNRRAAGAVRPWRSAILLDAVPLGASLFVIGFAVYVATWSGWLISDGGWGRQYHADGSWLPQPVQALWAYHRSMYNFHVHLTQDHPYQASAWSWLLQARPTSFYFDGNGTACGAAKCASAVNALGNPLIWWPGVAALLHQSYRAVMVRDWRSAAVVVGVLAGWVPWLFYPERTTFSLYSVVLVPFLVAALTLSLGQILGTGPVLQRRGRVAVVGVYLLAVVVTAWWFYPIWTGTEIPWDAWRLRMWLPSWV